MQEKGFVLGQRMNYSMTILKIFQNRLFGKVCKKNSVFPPKKCKRKGVFFANFARERVWVRRLHWHTRVQKLGKSPPSRAPPGV